MFTYARPASSALRTAALTFAVPLAPLLHGAHSATITGPGLPRRPLWICAAVARPVRRLYFSLQAIFPVVPNLVTVAVNVPTARFTLPFGFGTSCFARSVVLTFATTAT